MTQKSNLWYLIESCADYSDIMNTLKKLKKLPYDEVHNDMNLYELAVFKSQDVRLVKYLTEKTLFHSENKEFDFSIATYAILNSNEKILLYLLSKGLDIADNIELGCGPLHVACSQNENPKVIETIIKNGADVNLKMLDTGETAFLIAARQNTNVKILQLLIKYGANPLELDAEGKNALHSAAMSNPNPEIVEFLVKKLGFDVNGRDFNGATPCLYACQNPNMEVHRRLTVLGGHTIAKDKMGQGPVFYCVSTNPNVNFLDYLIWLGFDVNEKSKDGFPPLFFSCFNPNNEEIIAKLLEAGADANIEFFPGRKIFTHILERAATENNVKLLIKNTDFATNEKTRAIFLATVANSGNLKTLKTVINAGASVYLKSEDGRTALHFAAAFNSNLDVIDYLVRKGLSFDEMDKGGGTPFLYAVSHNQSVIILENLLTKYKVNPLVKVAGKNALHYAAETNPSVEVIDWLVNLHLYDINAKDELGYTPLMWATCNPNFEIFKRLLDYGADLTAKDLNGSDLLILAANNCKNPEMINFLLEKGFKATYKNNRGYDSIYHAAFANESVEVLELLIKAGASIDRFYPNGLNLLMVAARFNTNENITKFFIEKGLDLQAKSRESQDALMDKEPDLRCELEKAIDEDLENEKLKHSKNRVKRDVEDNHGPMVNPCGATSLLLAASNPNLKVYNLLLESGARLTDEDCVGRNSLNYAAAYNPNPMMITDLIVKFGFAINHRDKNGFNAAFEASTNPNLEVLVTMASFGADFEVVGINNITPLMLASIANPNPDAIKFLLEKGLSVHDTDELGYTPLLFACESNENPEIAELLIAAGANVSDINKDGDNAIDLSKKNPNPLVAKILEKYASQLVFIKKIGLQ